MSEEIKLKYRWRKTWPDHEKDVVGEVDLGKHQLALTQDCGAFQTHRHL